MIRRGNKVACWVIKEFKRVGAEINIINFKEYSKSLKSIKKETESKKITFADLKTSIIDESSFDQALLVSRLNSYNPTNAGNGLSATKLFVAGSADAGDPIADFYQDGSYFLNLYAVSQKMS